MNTKISEICRVINGRAYKQEELLEKGKYRVLRVGNFFTSDRWYYSDLELNEDKYCEKNDLLFAWSATFGPRIWEGERVIYHYHIWKMVPDESQVDKWYLYYWLKQNVSNITAGVHGSVMAHITKSEMENFELDLPPLSEQKKVSAILRTLDEKIKINSEINDNLLQQAQTLFISWFVDFDPFGGIQPDDWQDISVYDLADYINGAAFKKNEYSDFGLPIIKIAELKNGITESTQRCCVAKDDKYYINDRDILFSWSGNPETSIDTFIWSMGHAILNQHTFRVVSKYDAPAFTFFLLKYLKPQFTHIASNKQTTGLGHVTVADLKRLQFRANVNTILEFNALVMPMFDLIYSNYKEIQRLATLRDALLPQLMSGELDVSELDI